VTLNIGDMGSGVRGGLNGKAPRCDHLDDVRPVEPQFAGCGECEARGDSWLGLLVCLTCGQVACSDNSPNKHAKAHYEETDHPVATAIGARSNWRWCYPHGRFV
jgi:uncharacterized UBP type Zn finger protein